MEWQILDMNFDDGLHGCRMYSGSDSYVIRLAPWCEQLHNVCKESRTFQHVCVKQQENMHSFCGNRMTVSCVNIESSL